MSGRRKAVSVLNQSLFGIVREFERFRASIAREHGVTVTELRALSRVAACQHVTPKQLAQQLELTTGAVTALTDRLVNAGLLTREPHPTDRRSLLLGPTDAGAKLMDDVIAQYEQIVAQSTLDIEDEKLEEFAALLDGVVAKGSEIRVA